jgi:hypothetical protein
MLINFVDVILQLCDICLVSDLCQHQMESKWVSMAGFVSLS